jgi:signal peptidase I
VAANKRTAPSGKPKNTVAAMRAGKKPAGRTGGAGMRQWWELVKSILGMLLIFFGVRQFLVEAYRIPSGSMIPTLLVGDWLFVNKLRYGPAIPFTTTLLPGYAEPRRGEVIVFVSPFQQDEADIGNDPTPTLVKRMVGMPGDTLHMRQGLLYVNGIAQRQGYATPSADPAIANESNALYAWQSRYALRQSRFGGAPAVPTHDGWGPLVVPAGHYFMLGDNRYDSKDSRYWGPVPRRNVRGRPLFVYFSYEPDCKPPLSAIFCARWARIGERIK